MEQSPPSPTGTTVHAGVQLERITSPGIRAYSFNCLIDHASGPRLPKRISLVIRDKGVIFHNKRLWPAEIENHTGVRSTHLLHRRGCIHLSVVT